MEPAGRASEAAGRASEPAGRASELAKRPGRGQYIEPPRGPKGPLEPSCLMCIVLFHFSIPQPFIASLNSNLV